MQRVHGRIECRLIILNKNNQQIGLTIGAVQELSSFLGTLARNSTLFPLTIKTLKKVKTEVSYLILVEDVSYFYTNQIETTFGRNMTFLIPDRNKP
ncbi:hypothetical protein P3S67_015540 [Capsicum chacoense]